MSYTPTNWNTGDTITASALNKIENGIANAGGGGGAVIITDDGTALDKTYAEIYDLVNSGTPCYIKFNQNGSVSDLDMDYAYNIELMPIVFVVKYSTNYRVVAVCSQTDTVSTADLVGLPVSWTYQATASNAYPTFYRKAKTKATSIDLFQTRT